MFVAWRDLRFAKGRFVLIGAVVALITLLVGFLSGLTGGLAIQNISGVLALPGDRIVFSEPKTGEVTFSGSAVTEDQQSTWSEADGVSEVQPLGISQTSAETADARVGVAVYGVPEGMDATSPTSSGMLSLSTPAASDLGVDVGDTVTIAGTDYEVGEISGTWWYSHTPVIQMTIDDWRDYAQLTGSPDAYATVLLVSGDADWDAVDVTAETVAESHLGSLFALSSFRSEIGSLLMIVGMLFGISALVIGAFFTVWTMQRQADIAVLKALGASTGSLVRDALGQAFIVLAIGVIIGDAVVIGLGLLAGSAVPFMLNALTTVVPPLLMIVVGLAGAAFALRSVTKADPLTALGSNR